MSQTIGPILGVGALTMVNESIFHDQPVNWRIPVATGLAALGFAGLERVWGQGARMLSYVVLVTVLFTRTNPKVPSPVESALDWWNSGGKPQ
jgi:hypothetical protein